MKNKFLVFLILSFAFLHSCKDDSKPESLEINITELDFQSNAGSNRFIIKSNIKWRVSASDTWFTCETSSGENNKDIIVNVLENNNLAGREGKITIQNENGKITEELKVTQHGVLPNITVPATAEFKPEGGEVKIQVTTTANLTWTVQIPDGSFVSEKSKTDNEIVFEASPNKTGQTIETVITFKLTGHDKEAKITITQFPVAIVIIRPAGTLAAPADKKYTTDAAEQDWKNYIATGNRFIMQDHKAANTTRGLHVMLLKNVTDEPTGPIEFKVEGFDPDAATVRWDQNDWFEGNNNTRYTIIGGGTANPPIYLNTTGLAPGEEAFLLFRIRNTAVPQNTEGEYISKFTVTGEGIDIEGTLEMTVIP